jgi:hypothetical protein
LLETEDNRELLAQKDALAKKRFDEFMDMRNKHYNYVHESTREWYQLKKQVESLEKDKKELQ